MQKNSTSSSVLLVVSLALITGCDEDSPLSSQTTTCTNLYTGSTVTDCRDGQTYGIVTIGTQTWMSENLNYSGDDGSGNRTFTKGWCQGVSNGDTTDHSNASTCDTYGRFYNWTDAMDIDETYLTTLWSSSDTVNHQGLCPRGWHVPAITEWNTLVTYLGGTDTAGFFLKSISGWLGGGNGSDAYGFSALPAGHRAYNGVWDFRDLVYEANFWAASEYSENLASSFGLIYHVSSFNLSYYYKGSGYSLRCLENR
jgi:uncharacterized protein (TIGR02145 family)